MPLEDELTVSQRVKKLVKKKIFSQAALAALMGVHPATISEHLKKKGSIPSNYLEVISREFPNISEKWLLTGEGPMQKDDTQTPPPYKNVHMKAEVVEEENVPLIIEFRNGTEKRHELQAIPLYDVVAAAGLQALHNSSNYVLDYISIPNLPKCDGAIYIKGDSMYPLLKHGDMVAFQRITDLPDDIYFGEMYVVDLSSAHREKVVVKYVQKSDKGDEYIKLVSYNEKHHPPKDVHLSKVRAMAEVKASIRLS